MLMNVLLDEELVKFFATSERMDGLKRSFGDLTSSVSESKDQHYLLLNIISKFWY